MAGNERDEIKEYATSKGVFLWQIAKALNITDVTLSRKLRNVTELDIPVYKAIIDRISSKLNA